MNTSCQPIQDQIVTLLYEEELVPLELECHLASCASCSQVLEQHQRVQAVFSRLPPLRPPVFLEDRIFAQLKTPSQKLRGWFQKLFLHPAWGAAFFLILALGGFQWLRHSPPNPGIGPLVRHGHLADPAILSSSGGQESGFTFVANVQERLIDVDEMKLSPLPDLERPLIQKTDLSSLEQSSNESVSSFKHQFAIRYMLDGEYDKACALLDQLIESNFDYSLWSQAVFDHLNLMKKMGKKEEMKRDLARLKEYAMTNPDLVRMAEKTVMN